MDSRTSKINYYLDIADSVSERATCLRRKYGAIIVRNDEIISTGYNGAPRGRLNCSDIGKCAREAMHIPSGQRYELCRSVHAEANAIISASVLVHQFCHVGGYTMVQGGSRTSKDIPPFIIAGKEPIAYAGLNIVGLRRRKFPPNIIEDIHDTYRLIYNSNLTVQEAIEQIEYGIELGPEVRYIIEFVKSSQRGIIR